ncbi:hypothetical protein KIW84_021220 [Lathyrus oleraceus]|uniref:Uncharacterized protein n=1 Tax=Pisum sativum TaxID=3888 RepID=A0A9D5B8Z6_PEA|nr:hypothetical protein KIW84_021220 [Pisum sativum]
MGFYWSYTILERQYYESDVMVGVIDSGIWPESSRFTEKGFGPPPTKWKGRCSGYNFTCNRPLKEKTKEKERWYMVGWTVVAVEAETLDKWRSGAEGLALFMACLEYKTQVT